MKGQQPLSLGRLKFINVLPVHLHLRPDDALFHQVLGVPSDLNRRLREGLIDASCISSVEYAFNSDKYLILPDLGICAYGPVRSVLLLSSGPMSSWGDGLIEAPFESDTSVALVKVLLSKLWKQGCGLAPEGQVKNPAAVLRIGDRALGERASGRWDYVWDLGQVWQQWTGLPFVFALWAVRREVADERPDMVDALHQALLASRDAGVGDPIGCAEAAAEMLGSGPKAYLEYFRRLHYRLGQDYLAGLELLYKYMGELGLAPADVRLEFFRP